MKSPTTRSLVLSALALAAGITSLLVSEPAAAEKRLFRVQRSFFGAPFPPVRERTQTAMGKWIPIKSMGVTIPLYGGAGRYENYLEPGTFNMVGVPSTAIVATGNPKGGKFTLPRSFIKFAGTTKAYSSTAFTGYTSFSYVSYVNGRARFRPNNPFGATMTARVVFPTTGANPAPKQGSGSPATTPGGPTMATPTFGGRYDFSRAGSLNITPGPNRFGGTMRILYDTNISVFYQYIGYFNPLFFKAYGTFNCLYKGMVCTQDLETRVGKVNANGVAKGQVTSTGMVSRFLLDPTLFMVTVPTSMAGRLTYRKIADPPAISKAYYLHLIAPWTTGKVGAYNVDSMFKIRPTITGYDKVFAAPGANLTFTRTLTTAMYNPGGMTVGYSYMTQK